MQQSSGSIFGRVTGMFAIVGFGLGLGTLLFLWATDYFEPRSDDFASAIFGGLALGVVMVFALLSGVILAAVGGMHAAHAARSSDGAVTAGFFSALIGHLVMVGLLGGLVMAGFAVLSPQESQPRPSPAPTVDRECAETFGDDSPICGGGQPEESEGNDDEDGIDVDQLLKLGLGAIPAGIVGGLTAATLFSRKEIDD